MMNGKDTLVEVAGLSKKFSRSFKRSLVYGMKDMFGAIIGADTKSSILRKDEFWAVKDINFTLQRGECLGLIGRNGAGKSTLLKMLNGLIRPDEGHIKMYGRVGAMIELGAGFNPLLTGRENIHINGQLLGFSKSEIDSKMKSIVDFSELGDFIDMPVQNFSSGMKVRLGFAIAAQMEPDVLIIDEVLAVGDLGFVLKCFNTIDNLLPRTAVIFVTHSMPQVCRICSQVMMLENGKTVYYGADVSAGIDRYYSKFVNPLIGSGSFNRTDDAELLEVKVHNTEAQNAGTVAISGVRRLSDLAFEISFKLKEGFVRPYLSLVFFDKEQRGIGMCDVKEGLNDECIYDSDNGFKSYRVKVVVPRINFSKGVYSIAVSISEESRRKPILRVQGACQFQVLADRDVWQPIEFESHWT